MSQVSLVKTQKQPGVANRSNALCVFLVPGGQTNSKRGFTPACSSLPLKGSIGSFKKKNLFLSDGIWELHSCFYLELWSTGRLFYLLSIFKYHESTGPNTLNGVTPDVPSSARLCPSNATQQKLNSCELVGHQK